MIFETADFYKISTHRKFQSLFGGFICSHILNQDQESFFKTINNLVEKNGLIVLMDNIYVEGSNHPITETDDDGNTYQTRTWDDGSKHNVLKNFPTENFLREKVEGIAEEIKFVQLNYFWILSYKTL